MLSFVGSRIAWNRTASGGPGLNVVPVHWITSLPATVLRHTLLTTRSDQNGATMPSGDRLSGKPLGMLSLLKKQLAPTAGQVTPVSNERKPFENTRSCGS